MSLLESIQGNLGPGYQLSAEDMRFLQSFRASRNRVETGNVGGALSASASAEARVANAANASAPSFSDMVKGLVDYVDDRQKVSNDEVQKVVTGESDNLHQAMIAMQEASVSMDLLVEVRNKLVEAYKELSSMQT
ncbi:MAG: flagellar hook-basal body complex protein FliE [Opitutales bacterium]|nr:flagellar hook-basal body complex protein FliE [Opitutales bacterium]